jgi:tetratricopeptide (TPR) repeat protein
MNLGECYMKMKNWTAALMQFQQIIDSPKKLKHLDNARLYLDIGICDLAKGDHQGAIDSWHTALAFKKEMPEAHLQLGMIFDAENHISSAITEYKEFIRTSNDERKIGKAKERIEMLNQKLQPAETDPERSKPSPYMRQQYENQQRRIQEQQRKQQQQVPRDSGF